MAGSLAHLIGESDETPDERLQSGWSLIENMGDAYECVEELLFVVLATTDDAERDEILTIFNAIKRGELDPTAIPEQSPELDPIPQADAAKAYIQVQAVMER